MLPFLGAVTIAAGAIFVAEFGDKSQLLILAFATRYPWRPVVLGLVLAAAVIQGISVIIGAAVGAVLPAELVAIASGLAFLVVAAWTLLGGDDEHGEADAARSSAPRAGVGLVATVAGTFVLAELGDKTMLATFALAASQGAVATWIGSVVGEVGANLVAVVVGRQLGTRLSPRAVRVGSAVLFAIAGVLILAAPLLG